MDKQPGGRNRPASSGASRPRKGEGAEQKAVGAEPASEPARPEGAPAGGETTFWDAPAEEQSEADAASVLLGDEGPAGQEAPAHRPSAPADAGPTLAPEEPGQARPEAPLARTEALGVTAEAGGADEGAAPPGAAPPPKPAAPARPAGKQPAAPAKGPASSKAPGKSPTVGDYRLLKKLGAGGMGTVYLAHQASLDRQVALKVLSRELAGKPAFVQRFLREARVMARLDHPNILRCLDVGEAQGWHYLTMEYAEGGSVEGWTRRLGRLSVGDALHVALACARALEHAHEQNLVHRDVKPENLLLTAKGVVKLADLGLAKVRDDDLSLTKTGTGAGTPLYMAPEQARDVKRVDGRSDIYALGCMLYHFLTGRLPFAGDTLVEVISAKEKGKFAPARQFNAELPARLDLILDKMLAANPAHRYRTCGEIIAELEALGLANDRLSFLEPQGTAAGKAAAAPPRPAAADTDHVTRKPTVHVTAPPPSRPRAPAAEPDAWYVQLSLPNGRTVVKKTAREELIPLIREGKLAADTRVSRSADGPFRGLASFPELNQVLQGQLVKARADRVGMKYRALYEQIEKEDARRRRWRWFNKLADRVGSFFAVLLGLAILAGIGAGLFFGGKWLLFYLADKLHL